MLLVEATQECVFNFRVEMRQRLCADRWNHGELLKLGITVAERTVWPP
jgi:hypothetical protein